MTDSGADGLRFYVGLHQPSDAHNFDRCMISIARLRERRGPFAVGEWMLDSGAFRELDLYGRYRDAPEAYAAQIVRWARVGELVAAASQDYMCEPMILAKTRMSIRLHQTLTIARYDRILRAVGGAAYVLPVLQGYLPEHYAAHLAQYGDRLKEGAWVGVGSVCKRNGSPREIAAVLRAIKQARPDLRLHGFGCKKTALKSQEVRALLYSADSMAWSYSARKQGRDGNSWREAERFSDEIANPAAPPDLPLFNHEEHEL